LFILAVKNTNWEEEIVVVVVVDGIVEIEPTVGVVGVVKGLEVKV
jgi:hypothetical protein